MAWKERLVVETRESRDMDLSDLKLTSARLTSDQIAWLEKMVKEGRFESKAHAIRHAIKMLQERELPK